MADKEGNEFGWTMNARGVIVYQTNGQPILIPHADMRTIVKDWATRFPEENPQEKMRVAALQATASLDQDLAAFRDTLRSYLRKIIDDPELLTLAAKIIHKMELH